jgi:hypothetical protein
MVSSTSNKLMRNANSLFSFSRCLFSLIVQKRWRLKIKLTVPTKTAFIKKICWNENKRLKKKNIERA